MFDHLITNCVLPGTRERIDIGIKNGRFMEIGTSLPRDSHQTLDVGGCLVCSPFVDSHFHLDAALTAGQPRFNQSGTLMEGIQIWNELKPELTAEALKRRVHRLLSWSIAKGTLCIRSHVDVTDPTLMAVEVLLEVKKEMRDFIDLQLVAFPQDGLLRTENGKELLLSALDKGIDVIGGIPHFERTTNAGNESITWLCELAAERGLLVDMHCDESDDPSSRHIEHLAYEVQRLGLGDRVVASHVTSMHSMDNYYVAKLLDLISESGLQVVCNPLINIHLQGRHDSYPKRRGLTRVPELLECGVNVAFGHDCVLDPWYPMGSHDMLEVAHMGAHCLHMMGHGDIKTLLDMVTSRGAQVMQLDHYGLEVGKQADFVVLDTKNIRDCLRVCPNRLYVFRQGAIIASTPPSVTTVHLAGGAKEVSFSSTSN